MNELFLMAEEEMKDLKHPYVGTEHFLLAFLKKYNSYKGSLKGFLKLPKSTPMICDCIINCDIRISFKLCFKCFKFSM
jgi:hypothetical protein